MFDSCTLDWDIIEELHLIWNSCNVKVGPLWHPSVMPQNFKNFENVENASPPLAEAREAEGKPLVPGKTKNIQSKRTERPPLKLVVSHT